MRVFFLVFVGCSVTAVAAWAIMRPGVPANSLFSLLILAVFVVPPLGTFWMLYVSIRHEEHPLPIILLAFVPYAFLWYNSERVKTGKYKHSGRVAQL